MKTIYEIVHVEKKKNHSDIEMRAKPRIIFLQYFDFFSDIEMRAKSLIIFL